MEIFKLKKRDSWHIRKENTAYSYCRNARLFIYPTETYVPNLEDLTEVYGDNLPKLCKACVQHAYEDDILDVYVK